MMDKILQYIEDMYVAPVARREFEILSFGDQLFSTERRRRRRSRCLTIPRGERSFAEAEGLGDWEDRHDRQAPRAVAVCSAQERRRPSSSRSKIALDDARVRWRAACATGESGNRRAAVERRRVSDERFDEEQTSQVRFRRRSPTC
jgi:hypothetical protein